MKTKFILSAILLCLIITTNLQSQIIADTLNNEKIVKLSKLGLQTSVIINKIQTSYTSFDVSTDALIELSEKGVSAEIINEMMRINQQAIIEILNQKDINDPLTNREPGIYYYNPKNEAKPFRKVDPSVITSFKSGGFGAALAQELTYGIAKSNMISSLSGGKSRLQIEEDSPLFYMYFSKKSLSGSDNWFFATASSPNEFDIVYLYNNKKNREMKIGDMNAYSKNLGIPDDVKVPFEYEEVEIGIYKIYFSQPLKRGEYCFVYKSATPTNYNNNKVFDFGIDIIKK